MGLLTDLKQAFSKRRLDAAGEYRAILTRHEAPEPGDGERLAEIVASMGITMDDVAKDIESLQTYQTTKTEADGWQTKQAAAREAKAALARFDSAEADAARARKTKRDELAEAYAKAGAAAGAATAAANRMSSLELKCWRLLGLPQPASQFDHSIKSPLGALESQGLALSEIDDPDSAALQAGRAKRASMSSVATVTTDFSGHRQLKAK